MPVLSPIAAHLICLGLVAADLVARTWRIQWLVRGTGSELSFGQAFVVNAFGDAACALTPMRLGGEPARLGGMLRARVPAAAAFVAISYEVIAAWPVILVAAAGFAWAFAPTWWADVGGHLLRGLRREWPWVAAVVAATVAVGWLARGIAHPGLHQIRRPLRRAAVYWRRMPHWPVWASVPMTVVNIGSRVGILVALGLTLPDPPPTGALIFGSFALLYAQMILPTPSGAGVVDLGFVGGAAGDLGDRQGPLLLAWRFYSNGIGIALGVWLAARYFGWPALRDLARRVVPR